MRSVIFISGILGAQAVIAGAVAAHGGYDPYFKDMLDQAAMYQLVHLAVLLATCFITGVSARLLYLTQALFIAGIVLFCGSLYLKGFFGVSLFPMSAPLGGISLISGWLGLCLCAFNRKQLSSD